MNKQVSKKVSEEMKWKQQLPFTDLFSRRFD